MGGGDLNSKKSWHPNTMKNQERVWKAEQAAAEEKKRIMELQNERAEERDRAELNEMAKRNAGATENARLNWMYDKPDKKVQDEDYLLGKTIEKNYGQSEKEEQDAIPAVARRVVGSSMLASSGDSQVDLARKMREDPLLLVKERERAARAALLNNPLQRRRLTELLRKEQEEKKIKAKKKSKDKDNLDDKLAAKLSALGAKKNLDIAKLLGSDDSSSDSDDRKSKKKKKKKESKKKKKAKKSKKKCQQSESEESSSEEKSKTRRGRSVEKDLSEPKKLKSRKRKSESEASDCDAKRKRKPDQVRAKESYREDFTRRHKKERECESSHHGDSSKIRQRDSKDYEKERREGKRPTSEFRKKPELDKRTKGLSEEEKAMKLAEMAAAGAEREVERGRRVERQRRADEQSHVTGHAPAVAQARALPESLAARIHSNRHYIQRDKQHMNEHFARR